MKTYPAVTFTTRYGRLLAVAIAILVASIGGVASYIAKSTLGAVGTICVALFAWFFLRVLSELVEIVVDSLLPH